MFRISTLEPFQEHQDQCANAPWKVIKMDKDDLSHQLSTTKILSFVSHVIVFSGFPHSVTKASFCCIRGVASQAQQTGSNSLLSFYCNSLSSLRYLNRKRACFRAFCLRTLYRWEIKVQAFGISFELVFP